MARSVHDGDPLAASSGVTTYAQGLWLVRLVFERALAALYLVAFVTTFAQFPALLGERGLLPMRRFIGARAVHADAEHLPPALDGSLRARRRRGRHRPLRALAARASAAPHVPFASDRDWTEIIEARIESFAPGFRDTILARHVLSPAALERHDANAIGGHIVGGVADFAQLFRRPARWIDPYATPDPAIFICSASTPPGAGVHGMCGHHAARSALARRFKD
jgi:hypothetical protein